MHSSEYRTMIFHVVAASLTLLSFTAHGFQSNILRSSSHHAQYEKIRFMTSHSHLRVLSSESELSPSSLDSGIIDKGKTKRIMESTSDQQSSGAGGSSTYEGFLKAEENWTRLKESQAFEVGENDFLCFQNKNTLIYTFF